MGTEVRRWIPDDLQWGVNAKEIEDQLKKLR